ncbi:MAG: ribose 5-phosphate isomerase B [Bacteroidia bacterium]|jgi:ribose 5-phosphate isomerase B|nr:ribose 5-phosphate isomerase B [Bacteroidia bacterium]
MMKNKNIAIGSDHAGFDLKEFIKGKFGQEINWTDMGPSSANRVDYPDYAHKVAESVSNNTVDLGILICGSGNGVCMTANKHEGVRAGLAWESELASLAREHNNANVICLPARFITEDQAVEIVRAYVDAEFEGGRHETRVQKIEK